MEGKKANCLHLELRGGGKFPPRDLYL